MRSFLKNYFPFFISSFICLASGQYVSGQNFLNIDSHGDFISAGLEENYYVFVNAEFKETWSASYKTSVYTESLSKQLFITSFQKEFKFNSFIIQPKIIAGGKYSDGFHFAGVGSELNYSVKDILSIGFNPMLFYYDNRLNFRFQAGSFVNLYKEMINWFIEYGPPVYIMNSENNLTSGIFFAEERLKVAAGLQVPDTFDFKYTRVVTSFLYSFGNLKK